MLMLFLRAIILYALMFVMIRIMGKRQISELQPFDFIVTLLIADLASEPASDLSVPLLYGLVPILTLFLLQRLASLLSLKSEKLRRIMCGHSLLLINKGIIEEGTMRQAHYSLDDLTELLRVGGVYKLSDVEYAILETNGSLSVIKKGESQSPTYKDMNIEPPGVGLPLMVIEDGRVRDDALIKSGHSREWLREMMNDFGYVKPSQALFAYIDSDGMMHMQAKQKYGGRVHFADTGKQTE